MTRQTTRTDISREIRDSGILASLPSGAPKAYLMFLADCSGSDPTKSNYRLSWFRQSKAAKELGYSRKRINECRMYLERLGIITVRQHKPGRPLLETEIVDISSLYEIAERIERHGLPPREGKEQLSPVRHSQEQACNPVVTRSE